MRSPLTGRDVEWEPCDDAPPEGGWCAFREDDGTAYLVSGELFERWQDLPLGCDVRACLLAKAREIAAKGRTAAFSTRAWASLPPDVEHRWAGPLHHCRVGPEPDPAGR